MSKKVSASSSEPVRFPANLPNEKWPKVTSCFDLMAQNKWPQAEAFFKDPANTQDITDSIGAGNQGWTEFNNPAPPTGQVETTPQAIGIGGEVPWFTSYAMQVNKTIASEAGGKVSCSAESGGVPCWISLDPTFKDAAVTSWGAGASGYVYPAKDQPFYWGFSKGAANQRMHATMEAK